MILLICSFLTAFAITFMAIPSIIKIAEIKHLFDEPDNRKSHKTRVPTLGGLAIFAGLIFSITFWSTQKDIVELQYIIASILILFFMGMKDDLFNLVAYKKLIGQLLAAFILVHWAGIRITSFYGIFGVWDLNLISAYIFSIFTIVVITNSFNLIDGIDCLAAYVGIITAASFGGWYFLAGYNQYAILSVSLIGVLFAFSLYNRTPAKIFMGDTGSLIVGLVLSLMAVKFIETSRLLPIDHPNKVRSVPVVTIGILILPLFDTLRVFAIRIMQGKSPFSPDRNHLHHLLLDLGLSHLKATYSLVSVNLLTIAFVFRFHTMKGEILLAILCTFCICASSVLAYAVNKKKKNKFVRFLNPKSELNK